MVADAAIAWLLDSDPALRWQVERDLVPEPSEVWQATRARIATEGFGARLLALQDPDGQWAGGAFFPADFDFDGPEAADGAGQPWTATTWTLNSLREWGLDAVVRSAGTAELLAANSRWEYDDLPYWGGEVDCCINAWTVANGVWLGADVSGIVDWFVEHRLADGGWNCEWVEGSTRSSFHSTLNSLKGLLAYDAATGGTDATPRRPARRRGVPAGARACSAGCRQANRSRRGWTGSPTRSAGPTACSTPPSTSARRRCSTARARIRGMAEAIEMIRAARQPDGTWLQARRHPGGCGSRSTCRRASRRSG